MLHLVYRFRPTRKARADQAAFWQWIAERQRWFYDGLPMVSDTRWHTVTIGPDAHCLEHCLTFADEGALADYREVLRRRSHDPEWARRSATQYEWWDMVDARVLPDSPLPILEPSPLSLARRSRFLLDNARYVTLATTGPDGPWSSPVNYVALHEPLRLLWHSPRTARHSQNVTVSPRVSGSLFLTGIIGAHERAGLPLDGAQLTGMCYEVSEDELSDLYHHYYEKNFFLDPAECHQWQLPLTEFRDDGPRRFYLLHVNRMSLFDTERWTCDKHTTRIEVPVE